MKKQNVHLASSCVHVTFLFYFLIRVLSVITN